MEQHTSHKNLAPQVMPQAFTDQQFIWPLKKAQTLVFMLASS